MAAAGCGAGDGAPEQLGANAQAAIDGSDCETVAVYPAPGTSIKNGQSLSMGPDPHCSIASTTSTSPDASYTNAGNCSNAYVTEVTGTTGRALSFTVGWHGGTLNSSNCSFAVMGIAAFGHDTSGWHQLGSTATLQGQWVSGLFNFCAFVVTAGSIPSLSATHTYDKVRASTFATAGFFSPVSVTGGVTYGTGPCAVTNDEGVAAFSSNPSAEEIARISQARGEYLIDVSAPGAPLILPAAE